jgi:hypothetical protein
MLSIHRRVGRKNRECNYTPGKPAILRRSRESAFPRVEPRQVPPKGKEGGSPAEVRLIGALQHRRPSHAPHSTAEANSLAAPTVLGSPRPMYQSDGKRKSRANRHTWLLAGKLVSKGSYTAGLLPYPSVRQHWRKEPIARGHGSGRPPRIIRKKCARLTRFPHDAHRIPRFPLPSNS